MKEKIKIAYSFAGEGKGHVARTVAIAKKLSHKLDILFFSPPTVKDFLLEHIPHAKIVDIKCLGFVQKGHKIDYYETMQTNMDHLKNQNWTKEIARLADILKEEKISAVISDFEPYLAHAAALAERPCLNINHPGIVLKYFSLAPDAILAQMVAMFMMPPAQKNLICSFFDGDIGPIIRDEIQDIIPRKEDFYLLYAKKASRKEMIHALEDNHIPYKVFPNKDDNFVEALSACKAVIAPAGHQLLSEALFLQKPVLAFPQQGQFEQRLNAKMLQLSGRGMEGNAANIASSVAGFVKQIDSFPQKAKSRNRFNFFNDTLRAARSIMDFASQYNDYSKIKRQQFNYFLHLPEKLENLLQPSA